jgi:hypothetical protein
LRRLQQPSFLDACRQANFTLVSVSELLTHPTGRIAHAA